MAPYRAGPSNTLLLCYKLDASCRKPQGFVTRFARKFSKDSLHLGAAPLLFKTPAQVSRKPPLEWGPSTSTNYINILKWEFLYLSVIQVTFTCQLDILLRGGISIGPISLEPDNAIADDILYGPALVIDYLFGVVKDGLLSAKGKPMSPTEKRRRIFHLFLTELQFV